MDCGSALGAGTAGSVDFLLIHNFGAGLKKDLALERSYTAQHAIFDMI
jgi:hypothetical protein